jgi:hypothetical protein
VFGVAEDQADPIVALLRPVLARRLEGVGGGAEDGPLAHRDPVLFEVRQDRLEAFDVEGRAKVPALLAPVVEDLLRLGPSGVRSRLFRLVPLELLEAKMLGRDVALQTGDQIVLVL